MADFAPPPGPPPPKVPEGWKAVWNEQYKEWFFVNIYTKTSTWEKPTQPVYPPPQDGAPPGAPPGYDTSTKPRFGGDEKTGLHSNNPYAGAGGAGASGGMSEDERLARQLQAEEDARRGDSNRGAADGYYGGGAPTGSSPYGQTGQPQYGQQQQQVYGQQDQKKSGGGGLLGKLASKLGSGGSRPPQQSYGQQPMYGQQQGYPPMQGGYGGYPPQQGYGGYPQQGMPPRRTGGGGMGMAGGAALGAGAGLLGGAMLMNEFDDHEEHEQQEAYQDGYQDGQQDDGGDFGGGDDMGGDF